MGGDNQYTLRTVALIALMLVAGQTLILFSMGHPLICSCGYVKLWEGAVLSVGASQQFTDWYSFSHVVHGFIFYLLFWLLFPRMTVAKRFLLALGMEVCWEIIENTPTVINLYRDQALAQGYAGDSILNSLSDTAMMIFGFVLSWRFPTWSIIALAVGMEIFTGYMIHDNLTLNVLNFIHPFEFIRDWQNAAL
jgi:hypothetical protein